MQHLAERLGCAKMALYRHVPGKDVWRDTPLGAIVHSSDSDIALSSWVSTPIRARHPDPSGCQVLPLLFIGLSPSSGATEDAA
jgi:AcrR family transcriptional regulator